ncbi:MAG: asparagine synthase-related protein [Paracoccaceae bacterium]
MGSIFGVFDPSGRTVRRETLLRMNDALEYRTAEYSAIGLWGNLGLGMRRTQNNPLPSHSSKSIAQLEAPIAVDARLDNHAELCAELGLDRTSSTSVQVVAQAFTRWGERCTDHFLGDFAFVLHDAAKNQLFCARDHFGVRPFYYARPDGAFVFATDPRAILAIDDAPRQLCKDAALDFLLGHFPDDKIHLLAGIKRLHPAQQMTVGRAALKQHSYWRLKPEEALAQTDPRASVAHFRRLFTEAVATRLGPPGKTGTFLSGGLDSSSVTACAAAAMKTRGDKQPLQVFSEVFPDVPESDESGWIARVCASLTPEPGADGTAPMLHCIGGQNAGPMKDAATITRAIDEPISSANFYISWDLVGLAAKSGTRIMLTGHDGDIVVGHGFERLTNLAVAARWDELETTLVALEGMLGSYESARRKLIRTYVNPAVGIHFRKLRLVRALSTLQSLHRNFNISRRDAIVQEVVPFWLSLGWRSAKKPNPIFTLLQDSWKLRWRILRRRLAHARRPENRPELQHAAMINLGVIGVVFETYDRLGAVHGVELRHPFFDKRLVEFCVSQPPESKTSHGLTRWVLREAMQGILIDDVRLRRDKANLGPSFLHRLQRQADQLCQALLLPDRFSQTLLADDAVRNGRARFEQRAGSSDALALYRAACFKLWTATRSK